MGRSTHIRITRIMGGASLALSAAFLCSIASHAQPAAPQRELPSAGPVKFVLTRSLPDSVIQLPHRFIASASEAVLLDSTRVLSNGREYTLDDRYGTLRFDSAFVAAALADTTRRVHEVRVSYLYFPFRLHDAYFHRKLVTLRDSTGTDTLRIAKPPSTFSIDEIFGPTLQKSGSIARGFTVGSNRDFSLNSGLRLQLSGKIASDIDIAASLTDENTPIQPEGTTQTLQEFDKVSIEIKSTDVAATLGDYNLDLGGTEFARVSRKLQGAMGNANYRLGFADGSAVVSGAITRGKYNTNQFAGSEGVQGPYRLTGRNNEQTIIVIAGTERVYINGEEQTRGEPNDYTIDYSTGEVTFTPRRLITAASRIVIDFQYTDRQYSRSLYATQMTSNFLQNKARFTFSLLREADDPSSPIDFVVTDSARQVLENAGNDPNKAVQTGVTAVDSNGYYVRIDTVLVTGQTPVTFYRYAPGDPAARYTVTFSFVGFGRGDYEKQQVGVFTWIGPGQGSYLPIRFLPLPQLQQVMDFALNMSPRSDLTVGGEYARSVFDANRFSPISDQNNGGHALNFIAAFSPKNVLIGGTNIGSFNIHLKDRYVNARFTPVDRTNDIEFTRKWGVDTLFQADEEIREASLQYLPLPSISVATGYGRITRGDEMRSTRNDATFSMKGTDLPTVDYYLESVRSREQATDAASSWLRQKGAIQYSVWKLTPSFRYEAEHRTLLSLSTDTLANGSFNYGLFAPGFVLKDLGKFSLSADYEWRTDNAFNLGAVVRQAGSFTQSYSGKLAEWNDLSSSLDVTLRKRSFSREFKLLGNSDVNTVLVRDQTRYSPFHRATETDLFYQVTTERSSKLQRVFVRVAQGTGNYVYLGDLNHNGIGDDNEFVLTRFDGDYVAVTVPTDQLYPIIDLETSVRFRLTPARFFERPANTMQKILAAVSTETYARVEEKSTERDLKQIYLLHFSKFRQDSTTIAGSTIFTQDLYLFQGEPLFSTRFRFSETKGLNNLSGGIERNYVRERSLRLRWQFVTEIANQIDYVNKIDRLVSAEASSRVHDILSNDFIYDLSYRPEQNVECGFKVEQSKSTDFFATPAVNARLNAQSLRVVWSLLGAGQLRVESSREEILLDRSLETFPYELTGGRVVGKTWLWRLAFDYRIAQFVQTSVNYEGRTEGGRAPIHTARAEARAFF